MKTIAIAVHNSYSKIESIDFDDFKNLRNELSYEEKNSFFSGNFNARRYLLDKKGIFPTGLLHHITDWCKLYNRPYKLQDYRLKPPTAVGIGYPLNLPVKPYLEQLEAVKMAIQYERGTISMVTASGKSITMALLISKLCLKTLIIVPNLCLKAQLTNSFTQYFSNLDNIVIKNIDDPSLDTDIDYDCIIIDEAHHVAAKTYRKLNKTAWSKIYYRFFFTGTPFRSKDEEQLLMEGISGEVIYSLSAKTAMDLKIIVPVESYYFEVPKIPNDFYTWAEVYSNLVTNNIGRNELIANLAKNLNDSNKSFLILVKEIKHGRYLSKLTGLPFACGEDENSLKLLKIFNQGKNGLIGTVGILGEGCDTKPAEYILIASLGKSKPQFMQMVGRGLRRFESKESCKVIIFKDTSHKFTLRHFKEQVKILKDEYGSDSIKL